MTTRLLPPLLILQAIFIASPIATIDGLLTSPRAVGAQIQRADVAASVLASVPFFVALIPIVMLGVAVAVRRDTRGSLIGAGILSAISLISGLVPRLREMTFLGPVLHGVVIGLLGLLTLIVVIRSWRERTTTLGRSRVGRVTAAVVVIGALVLGGLGAISTSIPNSLASKLLSGELDFTTAEPSTAIDMPISREHPFLAPNPNSNIHGDAAMTDAFSDRGPLDPREAKVISRHLGGVCASMLTDSAGHLIAACVNATRVTLNVLDPATLELLDRKHVADRPFVIDFATNFAGGGYAILDNDDRIVLPTADGRITRWRATNEAGEPEISAIDEFDVSGALADGEAINSALPDASGLLWFVGTLGTVGVLDFETGEVNAMRFDDADIENSFAVSTDGGAYVVTSRELVFLQIRDHEPRVIWSEAYDRGTRRKPGQTSRASGTTPTLMLDERYVAITDNAEPRMNVLVFDTKRNLDDGEREICRVPVFGEGVSASDNSLIAIGSALFVENNYGYELIKAVNGRSTEPGLTRIDVSADGCAVAWENDELRIPSVVSKGTASGAIISYTKPASIWGVDRWYFTAIDATTGETMWRRLAGNGPFANNHYAAIYLGPDGSFYVGATGGIIALVPD